MPGIRIDQFSLGRLTQKLFDVAEEINLAAAVDLAKLLLGKDPLNIEERNAELVKYLVRNSTIRSAFDIALYDILGKASGLPLYAVLGGGKRSFWTDNTIGIGDPDAIGEGQRLPDAHVGLLPLGQ